VEQRHRSGWDLAAAAAIALAVTAAVLAVSEHGMVTLVAVVPVAVLSVTVARLSGSIVAVDAEGIEEVRPSYRRRLSWDQIDHLVTLDSRGRIETCPGGYWTLGVVLDDGRVLRVPTVRGLRALGWMGRPSRARVFADELISWHALRNELRNPVRMAAGGPNLRLVSGN